MSKCPSPSCPPYVFATLSLSLSLSLQNFHPFRRIYIYIVIHRQTVSFYQNSLVWLDTQDARSRDRTMHFFMDANQTAGEETWRQLHKNVESNIEQVLATTPHETQTLWPPASHHENYTGQTSQTRRTLLEKQRRARKWRTTMDPHIWPSKSKTTSSNLHTAAMWGHRM